MTRQHLPPRRCSRVRLTVRLLVFTAALAGLIAMHGLSDHAAPSHEMNAPMDPAVMAMSHASHMADDARNATDDTRTVDRAPDEDSPGMAMAGLCLAVLAGAIFGFLLLRPHRGVVFMGQIALAFVPGRPSGRRDRDPPRLFELSVLRS